MPRNPEPAEPAPKDEPRTPTPEHYIAVKIGGKDYWAYGMKKTGDASSGITIELTNLEPVEPSAEAEPEYPPTVTLTDGNGEHTYYRNITRIEARPNGGCYIVGDWLGYVCPWVDPDLAYYAIESPAEISRLARIAWGLDWSCPGCAEPCRFCNGTGRFLATDEATGTETERICCACNGTGERMWGGHIGELTEDLEPVEAEAECAEPTVTLHSRIVHGKCVVQLVSITSITEAEGAGGPFVQGTRADGYVYTEGNELATSESAAEITEKVRAAWGKHWSCPGCVDPVVVLHNASASGTLESRIVEINRMEEANGGTIIWSRHIGQKLPTEQFPCEWVIESIADIITACEKAGVPCVGEESPKVAMVTFLDVHGNAISYTEIFSLRRGLDEECAVSSWVRGRTLEGMVDRTAREIALSPSGILELCLSCSVPCSPEEPPCYPKSGCCWAFFAMPPNVSDDCADAFAYAIAGTEVGKLRARVVELECALANIRDAHDNALDLFGKAAASRTVCEKERDEAISERDIADRDCAAAIVDRHGMKQELDLVEKQRDNRVTALLSMRQERDALQAQLAAACAPKKPEAEPRKAQVRCDKCGGIVIVFAAPGDVGKHRCHCCDDTGTPPERE